MYLCSQILNKLSLLKGFKQEWVRCESRSLYYIIYVIIYVFDYVCIYVIVYVFTYVFI